MMPTRNYPGESFGSPSRQTAKKATGFTTGWRPGAKIDGETARTLRPGDVLIKRCNHHPDEGATLVAVLTNREGTITYMNVQRDGVTKATPTTLQATLPHSYKDFWRARPSHAKADREARRLPSKKTAKAKLRAALEALGVNLDDKD
jgi:hypothetical protein